MAAVLDALAPYLRKLITDMAQAEVSMLLGVPSEITKLEDNMENLRVFLEDADRRRLIDQSVQRWVRKLKDAMYDATDIVDLCQLEVDKRRESRAGSMQDEAPMSCFKPLFLCLRNPAFAHEIGSRIKELNKRLEDIHKEADKFKFDIGLGSNLEPRRLTAAELSSYKTRSQIDELDIVGEQIERDTKELIQLLTMDKDNNNTNVVSIVGTGGIGKTTLAQKIFNEPTVQAHFKVKIWLCITQHFDDVELLRTAIKHAGGHHGGEQDTTTLTDTLIHTLASAGRFLLVMDDVWSGRAWNNVLGVPIRNASRKQSGSWVLVTTRSTHVPQQMQAAVHQHRIRLLDQGDAWSLLKKQLRPDQVARVDHLKDVGIKIVRKCGGLPLAVKVLGGLLSTRSPNEHEWEAVLNHHAWSAVGLPEMDTRIYLSYDDLSPQLKQCFLYCSLIPNDTGIWQFRTISMWISEGFIKPHYGNNSHDDRLEEVAAEYYHELITRNLIEPTKGSYITGYVCKMHDVVRSFAEFIAKEDSLVIQDRQAAGVSNNHSLIRRISIGPGNLVTEWAILPKQGSLRTLVINGRINFKPNSSLANFSRLRVLFIMGADCDVLVDSICQLRHLRCLYLDHSNISRLPDNIHLMKFLQHILLRFCRKLENLPRTITKLVHLRTLNTYGSNENIHIPKGFDGLTNLRILLGYPVHMDMDGDRAWCSLAEIGPLSQLRSLSLYGLENVETSSWAEMATISSKEHLHALELQWSRNTWIGLPDEIKKKRQQRVVEEVFEKLRPPPCVQNLNVKGYFGSVLPNWMMVQHTWTFNSLKVLMLQDIPCCAQLPNGLCRLPGLEALKIEDAPSIKSVGPEFQSPSSLEVGGGIVLARSSMAAFPSLTNLVLKGLSKWEEWDWEEKGEDDTSNDVAMPVLSILAIENSKLRCLPPGLAHSKRHALRRVKLCKLTNLISVQNFPSIVDLHISYCPKLKRISSLSRLQKIWILCCPNIEVIEGVTALDSMMLCDATMETVPEYLTAVNPRYLELHCGMNLHNSLSTGSNEWNKISHIEKCKFHLR